LIDSVLIDVLIYSAAQLQECLINLLTYLLTYSLSCLVSYSKKFSSEASGFTATGLGMSVVSSHYGGSTGIIPGKFLKLNVKFSDF